MKPSIPPFAQRVVAWQRAYGRRDLPWQQTRDPYRIWLSEIMLQQTQVATVLPYYARFISTFPTVAALAAAPLSRVLELWSGLGYYRRAHHLHAAAKAVVERHRGEFPSDSAALKELPGVGRSSAAAIAAFASHERGAILDGNVKRVLARHQGIEGWPGEPRVAACLWRAAEARLPSDADIAAYTQGMMDLGAIVCTRARPRCEACPVSVDCIARRDARIDALPSPRPRKALPQRAISLVIVEYEGQVLLEQRPPVGIWSGLWSFPEIAIGDDAARYVATRLHAAPETVEALSPLTHTFTHFTLTMHPHRIAISRKPALVSMPGHAWFTPNAALDAALPSPIRRLILTLAA